jgi:hypothetical protein
MSMGFVSAVLLLRNADALQMNVGGLFIVVASKISVGSENPGSLLVR